MNLGYSYAQINLRQAVDHMAMSPSPLRKRIGAAYVGYVSKIQPDQVPACARNHLEELGEKFTQHKGQFPAEGSATASLREMGWQELHRCAGMMVELSHMLDAAYFETDK